jgi:DNA-binding beta-propeller fold protein YncE
MFDNGNMVVANADSSDSKLLLGTECGIATVDTLSSKDLSHPYGVAAGFNPTLTEGYPENTTVIYASNQNSLVVSYYVLDETLSEVQDYGIFGPNGFFDKIRGTTVNPLTQELILADEGVNIVYFLDANGQVSRYIKVSNPIGTYVSDGILFVSSNDDDHPAVYAYNLTDSLTLVATYQTPKVMDLSHPCGISSCGDDLLILSQDNRSLLVFSKSTAKYLRTIITGFGDDPEQIIVLNCANP